jgi:hypothetical protein
MAMGYGDFDGPRQRKNQANQTQSASLCQQIKAKKSLFSPTIHFGVLVSDILPPDRPTDKITMFGTRGQYEVI